MEAPADKDAVIARYREGPDLLEKAVAGLTDAELDTPYREGGWTVRQIVHHLADGDDIWKMGIKQALGNDRSEFPMDWYRAVPQDTWPDSWGYAQRPIGKSLALLRAIREHVIQLIEHTPDAWTRAVGYRNPNDEIEMVPVGFIIEMQADHIPHHVKQIESISR
jgi:uncharacterized damage-inducible protein DinB